MNTDGTASDFRRELFRGLVRDLFSTKATNVDHLRFRLGGRERAKTRLRDAFAIGVDKLGVTWRPRRPDPLAEKLVQLTESLDRFERVYHLFDDDASRDLWLELIRYKALGPRRVRLSRNSRAYWDAYKSIDQRFLRERDTAESCGNRLHLYEVPGRTGPIRIHTHPLLVLNTFVLGQYAYGSAVRAEQDDVVIDGGACWGDTALAFADAVGPRGRVHCFEFVPDNLSVFHENLRLNPELAERISLHTAALWRTSDQIMEYDVRGPGTSLLLEGGKESVQAVSLDDFVSRARLERVDFVKLDIEDAELAALAGASQTIASFRPKLAVAIYHSDEQFVGVPERIVELDPDYRLFLDHLTVHDEETVLYATAAALRAD